LFRPVWLRDLWDTNRHPVNRNILRSEQNILYRKLSTDFGCFGFSFNPGLRRTADYKLIAPFHKIGGEQEIGFEYKRLNYYGAILEQSAVEHIGWGRHISDNTLKEKSENQVRFFFKKINLFFQSQPGEIGVKAAFFIFIKAVVNWIKKIL